MIFSYASKDPLNPLLFGEQKSAFTETSSAKTPFPPRSEKRSATVTNQKVAFKLYDDAVTRNYLCYTT
jgi:hypothetical protein